MNPSKRKWLARLEAVKAAQEVKQPVVEPQPVVEVAAPAPVVQEVVEAPVVEEAPAPVAVSKKKKS